MSEAKPSPRVDLAGLTRGRVLEGVGELLSRGDGTVTFEALARQSGVPQRTLYRYFPSKDALLEAFWLWLNEALAPPDPPTAPDDLPGYGRELFAAFDRRAPLVRAMLRSSTGRQIRQAHAEARRAKFRDALRPVTDGLPADDARSLVQAIALLCSARGWEGLTSELPPAAAGEAVAWATAALIQQARQRRAEKHPR